MSSAKTNRQLKTVGIWLGFTEPVNLHREGIGRFLRSLCFSLVRDCDVSLEFWCYESNRAVISAMFNDVLEQATPPTTAGIFSERHRGETLFSLTEELNNDPNTSSLVRRLEEVAEQYSNAQVFLVYSPRLHNVLKINRPKVVYVPDLAPLVYSELSEGQRGSSSNDPRELRAAIEAFAESGAAFCCNSPYVAREHLLKYVPSQAVNRIFSVFLPGIPPESQPHAFDEAEVRNKYGLPRPFLFYPTQNRPYKRLELLIKALARLNGEGLAPDLLLTASGGTVDHLKELAKELGVTSRLVLPGEVSSFDLYALHRAAAVTVVTTLFEGGFPWQAIESMSCNTPVVMSRIPVVEERLKSMNGVSCDDLVLFEPDNLNELCQGIRHALRHRTAVVESQDRVVEAFNRYTWSDVAFQYSEILSNQANGQCRMVSFKERSGILQTLRGKLKKCWPISYLHDLYLRVQSLEHSHGLLQSEIGQLRHQ
jgi:glycosyltransferase involved in cell wall biosynthesis